MRTSILRALWRDKSYALINVAGLSLAMTACIVLGLYLSSELTYDRHHAQHERVFRVATEFTADGGTTRVATSPSLFAPMLAEDFADVQAFVRFRPPGHWETGSDRLIRHGDDAFYWSRVYLADANVFDVFTHEILHGDPRTALVDPYAAAVSRSFARKYFGDANPLGEILTLDNGEQRTITLVFADLPENTHLRYDVLFSYNGVVQPEGADERARELFGATDFTYLVMPEGFEEATFPALADAFFARYMLERAREIHVERWTAWLQPLADIHLHSDVGLDLPIGNRYYLLGLQAAVAFILLIACINHVNLATAAAVRRGREIGTRKILGATRRALALRFVGESMLLAGAAWAVSLALLELVVPMTPIAEWLGNPAVLAPARQPGVLAAMAGFGVLVGLLSGLYPAFYLSAIPPLAAMSNGDKLGGSGLRLRELLVLVQLTVTACVIACTLLMAAQMRFVASRPLGFEEQGRIVVTLRGADLLQQMPVIKRELAGDPRVLGITSSDVMLGREFPAGFMDVQTNDGSMNGVLVHHLPVADDFIDVLGMRIVAGRDFSPDVATDPRAAMIVNESLVRRMGWQEPIGKRMGIRGRTVVGVVRDFNFKSLHTPVEPLVIYQNPSTTFANIPPDERPFKQQFLVLNVATKDLSGTLAFIGRTIERFDPVHPFEYRFLDDALGAQYLSEQRLLRLIGVFSGISVFVACLGLFGLATFTTARRTREIGIRKVLGASTAQIVVLLSQRTLLLAAVGSTISTVLAYAAIDRWLDAFAYRIEVGPAAFVAAASIVAVVALLTVASQSLKAASTRPIHTLRHD